MTLPTRDDTSPATSASFWAVVIVCWVILFVIAGTLTLLLAIWHLIGAF